MGWERGRGGAFSAELAELLQCVSVLFPSLAGAAAAAWLPGAWQACWIMRMAHTTCSVKADSKWGWRHSAGGIEVWPHTGTNQCPYCDPQNPTGLSSNGVLVSFKHSMGVTLQKWTTFQLVTVGSCFFVCLLKTEKSTGQPAKNWHLGSSLSAKLAVTEWGEKRLLASFIASTVMYPTQHFIK